MHISQLKMKNRFCRRFEKSTVTVLFTLATLVTELNESYAPLPWTLVFLKVYFNFVFSDFPPLNLTNYPESSFAFWHCIWRASVYVFCRTEISKRNVSKSECTSGGREPPTSKNKFEFSLLFCSLKIDFSIFFPWISCIRNFLIHASFPHANAPYQCSLSPSCSFSGRGSQRVGYLHIIYLHKYTVPDE